MINPCLLHLAQMGSAIRSRVDFLWRTDTCRLSRLCHNDNKDIQSCYCELFGLSSSYKLWRDTNTEILLCLTQVVAIVGLWSKAAGVLAVAVTGERQQREEEEGEETVEYLKLRKWARWLSWNLWLLHVRSPSPSSVLLRLPQDVGREPLKLLFKCIYF